MSQSLDAPSEREEDDADDEDTESVTGSDVVSLVHDMYEWDADTPQPSAVASGTGGGSGAGVEEEEDAASLGGTFHTFVDGGTDALSPVTPVSSVRLPAPS